MDTKPMVAHILLVSLLGATAAPSEGSGSVRCHNISAGSGECSLAYETPSGPAEMTLHGARHSSAGCSRGSRSIRFDRGTGSFGTNRWHRSEGSICVPIHVGRLGVLAATRLSWKGSRGARFWVTIRVSPHVSSKTTFLASSEVKIEKR